MRVIAFCLQHFDWWAFYCFSSSAVLITMYSDSLQERNADSLECGSSLKKTNREKTCKVVSFIPRMWSSAQPEWRRRTPALALELGSQSRHSPAGPPGWRKPAGWQVWNGLWCKPGASPPASAVEYPSAFDWCLLTAKRKKEKERKDTDKQNKPLQ